MFRWSREGREGNVERWVVGVSVGRWGFNFDVLSSLALLQTGPSDTDADPLVEICFLPPASRRTIRIVQRHERQFLFGKLRIRCGAENERVFAVWIGIKE